MPAEGEEDGGKSLPAPDRMKCENCGKNPAAHAAAGGDGTKILLCDECYERLCACIGFSCAGEISDTEEKRCPVCGTTLARYRETGLLGCETCYRTFRGELLPVIRRMHGGTAHTGGRPRGGGMLYELLDERERLRAELETAVREKDMEKADRLNREISEISGAIARVRNGEDANG